MDLRVVGAGIGRTGTHSLKLAFEQLLGAPCYHMFEVVNRPEQRATWHAALLGDPPDWAEFLSPYAATVDWPAAAFWRELSERWPDAVVVLSVRDADEWWGSFSQTIGSVLDRGAAADDPGGLEELAMVNDLVARRFTSEWRDRGAAISAYEAHNAAVREAIDPSRFVEWRPGDGWAPLCDALGLPAPREPFPHVNTMAEFRDMAGLDGGAPAWSLWRSSRRAGRRHDNLRWLAALLEAGRAGRCSRPRPPSTRRLAPSSRLWTTGSPS